MLKFKPRVDVLAHAVDRTVYFAHADEARSMISSGRATIERQDRFRCVCSIRLTEEPLSVSDLGLEPGSFGIHHERIPPGITGHAGIVYDHRKTWEVELAQR